MAADRQRIEASLRQSEERYRAFIEQSSEAIWRFELHEPMPIALDPDEQIEHCYRHAYLAECNDVMARMYGYEHAGEVIGVRLGDFMPRQDEVNLAYLHAFIASDYRLTEAESHEVDRDGQPRNFLNNLIGIIEDGKLVRAWGTQRDITEHKRAEEAIRASERQLRLVTDNVPVFIVYCDTERRYRFVNKPYAERFGLDAAEILGKRISEVVGEEAYTRFSQHVDAALSGQNVEFEVEVPYDSIGHHYVHGAYVPDVDGTGKVRGFYALMSDITERKRQEKELKELSLQFEQQNRVFNAMLSHISDFAYIFNHDGRFIYANQALLNLWGLALEDAVGKNFFDLKYPDDLAARLQREVQQVFETQQGLTGETSYTSPTGASGYYEYIFRPVLAPDGSVEVVVGSTRDVTRYKHDEERARESEARYRQLADAMPQLVWTCGADGVVDYYNSRLADYVELERTTDGRWLWQPLLHSDDVAATMAAWRAAMETGEPYEFEHRILMRDGQYCWHLSRARAVCDTQGRIIKWFGTATDIHERKKSEEDARLLADVGERIRLAEDAQDLMWRVVCAVGEHLQVSNAFFTEVEVERGRFQIHRDYHAGPRSYAGSYDRSAFGSALIRELTAGHVVVVRDAAADPRIADSRDNYDRNGIRASVTVPLLRDEGQVSSLIVTTEGARDWTPREITLLETVAERTWLAVEKIRLDAKMQRANERFERAESAAHGFVYEWNLANGSIERTGGFTELMGYEQDEIAGDRDGWLALLQPSDRAFVEALTPEELAEGNTYSIEYRVLHKAGHYVWVWDQGRIILDEEQRPVRVIGSTVDITDRKRKEEQIARLLEEEQTARAEAERATRLKDEFLGLVSHELRSPLNAISGWVKLLRAGRLTPEETAKALATIERNAQSQNHLIEDLLDVSRVVAGKLKLEPQVIEPHTAIEAAFDTARPAAEAKGIRLELLSAPLGIALSADPNRLQQAVWNLLSNAIKFTPAGGRVSVTLKRVNNYLEIIVADSGIGIEPDFLPYVFERFRQADATSSRKYGGLGLGLAIVRHIVELHGGEIEAASEGKGQGAAFTLKLPLAPAGQTVQEPLAATTSSLKLPAAIAARLMGLRVLAVDDEEADRDMLKVMLNNYGLLVTVASSAAKGLEALRRDQFDALVCDISMPGEDGYAFIRQVRGQEAGSSRRLPAIALTGYARGEDRVRTLSAGFDSHVSKPVEPVELAIVLATLAERLGK